MKNDATGSLASIEGVINAVYHARCDWARHDAVYAQLGLALRAVQKAKEKAAKEVERQAMKCHP